MTIALSPTIRTAICDRMPRTLRSTWVDHFGAKFGEERVTDISQMLTPSGRDLGETRGCRMQRSVSICLLSTMHERDRRTDRQTDNQTDHGMVTSISVSEVAIASDVI